MKLRLSLLSLLVFSLLSPNINCFDNLKAYQDELKKMEDDMAKLRAIGGPKAHAAINLLTNSAAQLAEQIAEMQMAEAESPAKKVALYRKAAKDMALKMKEAAEKVAEEAKHAISHAVPSMVP